MNAASGFVVAGLARDLNDGIALAREQIDSGCALAKLRALRNYQPKVQRRAEVDGRVAGRC
jgi:anthranilate phosphoribosyltransferase